MIYHINSNFINFTHRVKSLQARLHNCDGACLRCNCLKESFIGMVQRHSAQLRLGFGSKRYSTSYIPVAVDLHHHSRTLKPAQPRTLG